MLKKRNKNQTSLFIILLLAASIVLAACGGTTDSAAAASSLRDMSTFATNESNTADEDVTAAVENQADVPFDQPIMAQGEAASGGTQMQIADRSAHEAVLDTAPPLSQEEINGLTYMREEEKLARDVYLALYAQWGVPIFQNIADSEQAHMDSILFLLDQYGLVDPAAGMGEGQFSDPLFQDLYAGLVAHGNLSLVDALTVGAKIEELDIVDLQERLGQTENEAIIQVYNNLLSGSENHLRAFVSLFERQTGTDYQSVYLDQETFEAIMNGSTGNRNGNGGNGGNGQRGNGQGGNGGGGNQGSGGHGNGRGRNNNA